MNIRSYIEEKKSSFRQRQNERDAKELQRLRKTRLAEEGRANIIKAKQKEKDRIKKARETKLDDLRRRFGVPEKLKGSKALPKKENKLGKGFGQGINPAFNIGKDNK